MTHAPSRTLELARQRRLAIAAAAIATAAIGLAIAPRATAGTYRAVQCHQRFDAGHGDATFWRSTERYRARAACEGLGLGIDHEPGAGRTPHRRFAAWTLAAPAGTAIVRADATVSSDRAAGHVPRAFVTLAGSARRRLGEIEGTARRVGWTGAGGRTLTARLECSRASGCGPGPNAHIHLRRIALALRDAASPSLDLGGSLLAPGSHRGLHSLRAGATDAGGGARIVTVELNGDPLASRVFDCRLDGVVALRLRPCPTEATARFELATTGSTFRQGPNRVRVCGADYAPHGNANRACESRTIRIDNACPVAESDATTLRARLRGGGSTLAARSDRPAIVAGRLASASGDPVPGVRVCVASRVRANGAAERVLVTPTTDSDGRFQARVPAGPSREIRVAHWPDDERVLERYLGLNVRAIPRLRLRPDRVLRNGSRARFRVELPGPGNGRRRVDVLARSGGHWIRIVGGRTSATGAWHGAYRFRSTTGTRRYAFRARVAHQAGYPYRGGRSRVARITVVGD